jgi:DNA-binding NtrC family response regulator
MTSLDADGLPEAGTLSLSGSCVLIVEDSWDVGISLKRLLEAYGAETNGPVATVAEALRLISEQAVDVALVDINLRNGEKSYGLIDLLHEKGIRTIVLTGYADAPLARGKVAAILQKPIADERLIESLRRP